MSDPVMCTATDTWWDAARPDEKISQRLRCYTPADLALLLSGTGLTFERDSGEPGDLLRTQDAYLAVLRHEPQG